MQGLLHWAKHNTKKSTSGFTRLAKQTVAINIPNVNTTCNDNVPNDPRRWGLKMEEKARKAYLNVQSHLHHKVQLLDCGFFISASKPFMGASLDNIRSCRCITGCNRVVVEYKCPWVHKDEDAKTAFLTKEIGGVMNGGKFELQPSCRYYYQVQMQMFVSGLTLCDFVVWTTKGVHCTEVPYDVTFMAKVCVQLEKFWIAQVAPLLILEYKSLVEEECNPHDMSAETPEAGPPEVEPPEVEQQKQTSEEPDEITVVMEDEPQNAGMQKQLSTNINGVDITSHDLDTLGPSEMINDNIATALLIEQTSCQFPVIDCLFYSILCGEQEGHTVSDRPTRLKAAE